MQHSAGSNFTGEYLGEFETKLLLQLRITTTNVYHDFFVRNQVSGVREAPPPSVSALSVPVPFRLDIKKGIKRGINSKHPFKFLSIVFIEYTIFRN
jgi:hypothetical protein